MEDELIKKNLKDLLLRYFEQNANTDTTSKKVDRINGKLDNATEKIEITLEQVNKNLNNIDLANDIAQKANEEARKFDAQAGELADMMAGNNVMMIVILVVVGVLLAVAVFANLYATIKGPAAAAPAQRKMHRVPITNGRINRLDDPVDYSSGASLLKGKWRIKNTKNNEVFQSMFTKTLDNGS